MKSIQRPIPMIITVLASALLPGQIPASSENAAAQATAVYEQGKKHYDAKDYSGALAKFDQAVALEPGKARWHYNRGLALRKLKRPSEARQALLQSRALDPSYKRTEIDEKLRELGPEPAPEPSPAPSPRSSPVHPSPTQTNTSDWSCCIGCGVFVLGAAVSLSLLIRKWVRGRRGEPSIPPIQRSKEPQNRIPPEALAALGSRLEGAAEKLIAVEHALRLGEDADLRAHLNQATQTEQRLRAALEGSSDLPTLQALLQSLEEEARAAQERARALFGEKAFLSEGERIGCFFCARPLASAQFRTAVSLKQGGETTTVLACPFCANAVAQGQTPSVRAMVRADGSMAHWSEWGRFDPYVHRHRPYAGAVMMPGWKFAPSRSFGELAGLAAGSAALGGLAVYGLGQLLDLDGAREAGAAQEATEAAALHAAGSQNEWVQGTGFRDQS